MFYSINPSGNILPDYMSNLVIMSLSLQAIKIILHERTIRSKGVLGIATLKEYKTPVFEMGRLNILVDHHLIVEFFIGEKQYREQLMGYHGKNSYEIGEQLEIIFYETRDGKCYVAEKNYFCPDKMKKRYILILLIAVPFFLYGFVDLLIK